MKRRKDSGFTLIELMIVIAVIGILAIVLVPKIGTVKTQSKATGLDANVRMVQGYVESKIDKWVSKNISDSTIAADIEAAFTGTNKALSNPFTSQELAAVDGAAAIVANAAANSNGNYSLYIVNASVSGCSSTGPGANVTGTTNLDGAILVVIDGSAPINGIYIYAYDQNGTIISEKTVHVTTI